MSVLSSNAQIPCIILIGWWCKEAWGLISCRVIRLVVGKLKWGVIRQNHCSARSIISPRSTKVLFPLLQYFVSSDKVQSSMAIHLLIFRAWAIRFKYCTEAILLDSIFGPSGANPGLAIPFFLSRNLSSKFQTGMFRSKTYGIQLPEAKQHSNNILCVA